MRLRDMIQTPIDPDIAVSFGAVQAGLAENLIPRPFGAPQIIAPRAYVIGIGTNRAKSSPSEGTRNSRQTSAKLEVFEYELDLETRTSCIASLMNFALPFRARYLVVKGALLKKGVPCFKTFTKTSRDPSGRTTFCVAFDWASRILIHLMVRFLIYCKTVLDGLFRVVFRYE